MLNNIKIHKGMDEIKTKIRELEHRGEETCIERTCIMFKPDVFILGRVGEVITRYESLGLKLLYFTTIHITREQIDQQYHKYIHQPFYPNLVRQLLRGPIVVGILEGHRVFYRVRKIHGFFNSDKGEPGELRTRFSRGIFDGTLVHCSEDSETYLQELEILLPGFNHEALR